MNYRLPPEVADQIGHYVYLYIDPTNDEVFYVGKGVGNRVFDHLYETGESNKVARINQIITLGEEPRIEFIRFGLTENEAAILEAAIIDLVGIEQLTNKVRGFHARSYGRISVDELIAVTAAQPTWIDHRAILITINKRYHSNMSPLELYEATRGIWVVGPRRERAELAFAVYRGVVREVYRVESWYPAGTLPYETRDDSDFAGSGRWEFEGYVADAVTRDQYLGKSVRQYLGTQSQNPIRYVNV